MPRCAWCEQIKPVDAFGKVYTGMLRVVCLECEKQPLAYCGFCGLPIHEGRFYKISDRLHECMDCHEQTQGIIRKNIILRIRKQIIQVTRKTTNMSEHLIGDLRSKLFDTIYGLMAGTVTVDGCTDHRRGQGHHRQRQSKERVRKAHRYQRQRVYSGDGRTPKG